MQNLRDFRDLAAELALPPCFTRMTFAEQAEVRTAIRRRRQAGPNQDEVNFTHLFEAAGFPQFAGLSVTDLGSRLQSPADARRW